MEVFGVQFTGAPVFFTFLDRGLPENSYILQSVTHTEYIIGLIFNL